MVDWLVYLVSGGFAGLVVAFVYAMFKVGPGKPEFNFVRCVAFCLACTLGGPFAFVEFQTKTHGPKLKKAVKEYFNSSDCVLIGEISYIKVLTTTKKTATVLLVGKELESWGGYDRPVMKLYMKNKGTEIKPDWYVAKDDLLRSARLNKDNFVWPPYQ